MSVYPNFLFIDLNGHVCSRVDPLFFENNSSPIGPHGAEKEDVHEYVKGQVMNIGEDA